MASRDVNWHPRLKPRTVFPSGFREDATKKGAKLVPIGSDRVIAVEDMIKVVDIEVKAIDDEIKARAATEEKSDLDVCFARFEVGERHPLERKESGSESSRRTTIREDENGSGDDPDHESDEEIMQQMKEAMASEPEGEHAPVTNIGDSICGQRALEQHPSGSSTEAQHGFVAGERVKRLSKREATAIVAEALSKDGFIFKWHQTHQKGGISGERFAAYSMNVKNREDFFRESKTKFYRGQKNLILLTTCRRGCSHSKKRYSMLRRTRSRGQ